jgi:hypothetical protein
VVDLVSRRSLLTFDLEAALDELAGNKDPHALLQGSALRSRRPSAMRAAEDLPNDVGLWRAATSFGKG